MSGETILKHSELTIMYDAASRESGVCTTQQTGMEGAHLVTLRTLSQSISLHLILLITADCRRLHQHITMTRHRPNLERSDLFFQLDPALAGILPQPHLPHPLQDPGSVSPPALRRVEV